MSYKIIVDMKDAKDYIEKLQKDIEFLERSQIQVLQDLVNNPNFRMYGKTKDQIYTAIHFYESKKGYL